jgi:hypothetical protein
MQASAAMTWPPAPAPASPSRQSRMLSSRTHSSPSPKSSSEILSSTRLPLSADRSTLAMTLSLCLPRQRPLRPRPKSLSPKS